MASIMLRHFLISTAFSSSTSVGSLGHRMRRFLSGLPIGILTDGLMT